jgi:hypothetical protein
MTTHDSNILVLCKEYLPLLSIAIFSIIAFIWVVIKIMVKRKVEMHFEKEFEKYKKGLEEKAEILKTNLSIYAHEQNVRISRFDAQRAVAVEKVYLALLDVLEKFGAATSVPGKALIEAHKNVQEFFEAHIEGLLEVIHNYTKAISTNAIYFDEELYGELKKSAEAIMKAFYLFGGINKSSELNKPPVLMPSTINYDKMREEFIRISQGELVEVRKNLTNIFRETMKSEGTK